MGDDAYTLAELKARPTLCVGQADDLKARVMAKSIRKKAKAPLTKCGCGQPLPTHLADIVDENFTHVCSCKKAYKVCSGLFIHIGEEDNPSAAFDEEVANTKCKRCKGGMDYIWVSLFHQITNKADKFPPFCMDCSRDILEDAEKYGL